MSNMKRVKRDVISGVYSIINKSTAKMYVGSSFDIYGRWVQHMNELEKGEHHSAKLQNSYNKHGKEVFVFNIIEIVDTDDRNVLFGREQYYIDKYDSFANGYNMSNNAWTPVSYTTIEDLEENKRILSKQQFEDVVYYLTNTQIPVPEISSITGVSYRTIYQIYYRESYKNLTENMIFLDRKYGKKYKLKKEDVIDISNKLMEGAFYNDIAKEYGISTGTVYDIAKKKTWKDITENFEFPDVRNRKRFMGKQVVQYDLDMNFIAEYDNARCAEKATGIGYKLISRVCNGERAHTHNYIFKFKNNKEKYSKYGEYFIV